MFLLILALPTVVDAGYAYGVIGYLFYRLQYNISTETYSDLISAWFVVNMFTQLVTVPFLSKTLGLQDTTIIILAIGPAILGFLAEAWRTEVDFYPCLYELFVNPGLGPVCHLDGDVPPLLQHLHHHPVRRVQAGGAGGSWEDLHHHWFPRVDDAVGGETHLWFDIPGDPAHLALPLDPHHVWLPHPNSSHCYCNPCGDGQREKISTRVRDNQDESNRECLLIIVQCKHNKYIKLKVLGPSGH